MFGRKVSRWMGRTSSLYSMNFSQGHVRNLCNLAFVKTMEVSRCVYWVWAYEHALFWVQQSPLPCTKMLSACSQNSAAADILGWKLPRINDTFIFFQCYLCTLKHLQDWRKQNKQKKLGGEEGGGEEEEEEEE